MLISVEKKKDFKNSRSEIRLRHDEDARDGVKYAASSAGNEFVLLTFISAENKLVQGRGGHCDRILRARGVMGKF